jgi:acylphosphatase
MTQEDINAVRVRVTGVVQGVGFRYFTHRTAVNLGLSGYVRNMPDGSVEAVAEGEGAMVAEFVEKVSRGPAASSVRGMTVSEIPVSGYERFEIRI